MTTALTYVAVMLLSFVFGYAAALPVSVFYAPPPPP